MTIEYKINAPVTSTQFRALLINSNLGERRPIDNRECLEGMLANSNLVVSAWDADTLIGIARSITDFHYACYLSDLAVSKSHQRQGVGKELQALTQRQLGPLCKLILVAAPAADLYYGQYGYVRSDRCWILDRKILING